MSRVDLESVFGGGNYFFLRLYCLGVEYSELRFRFKGIQGIVLGIVESII